MGFFQLRYLIIKKKCLVSLPISDTILRAHCVFCRSALWGWLALHYLTQSEGRSRSSFLQCFSALLNRKRGLHTHFNRLTHMSCWDHPCLPHAPTSPLLSSAVVNEPLSPSPLSSHPTSLSIQPGWLELIWIYKIRTSSTPLKETSIYCKCQIFVLYAGFRSIPFVSDTLFFSWQQGSSLSSSGLNTHMCPQKAASNILSGLEICSKPPSQLNYRLIFFLPLSFQIHQNFRIE